MLKPSPVSVLVRLGRLGKGCSLLTAHCFGLARACSPRTLGRSLDAWSELVHPRTLGRSPEFHFAFYLRLIGYTLLITNIKEDGIPYTAFHILERPWMF